MGTSDSRRFAVPEAQMAFWFHGQGSSRIEAATVAMAVDEMKGLLVKQKASYGQGCYSRADAPGASDGLVHQTERKGADGEEGLIWLTHIILKLPHSSCLLHQLYCSASSFRKIPEAEIDGLDGQES